MPQPSLLRKAPYNWAADACVVNGYGISAFIPHDDKASKSAGLILTTEQNENDKRSLSSVNIANSPPFIARSKADLPLPLKADLYIPQVCQRAIMTSTRLGLQAP